MITQPHIRMINKLHIRMITKDFYDSVYNNQSYDYDYYYKQQDPFTNDTNVNFYDYQTM